LEVWDLSCKDWEQRLTGGRAPVADLPLLNVVEADRALAMFDMLRLPDVPGTPLLADAAGDWFRQSIVRPAFGSWDEERQERYIREVFLLVGKKNSKTSYGAGLSLVWLLYNRRPNAEGILVAPTQDITDIAFSQAEGMVRLDPRLNRKRLRVQNNLKRITNLITGATLEILTFDPKILTGQKPAFWLLDEIHVLSRMSNAASAIGQLRGGMISQPEALGIMITTQSDRPPAGIFKTELVKARNIRDGIDRSTRMLPVLYEFPRAIAASRELWSDRKVWHMVVPNDGRSITVERLTQEFRTAEQSGPEELKRWASQHLNIEIGIGLSSDHWPGARHWDNCADETLTLATLIERSEVVTVGGDGGGLDDMLGFCAVGREKETRRFLVVAHAWIHRSVLDLRKEIASKFIDLETDGDLTIVDRMGDAFEEFADLCELVKNSGKLAEVGLDTAAVGLIPDELESRGITVEEKLIAGVRQGWSLMGVIKSVEDLLADGVLVHGGQALMAWCVGNARIEQRGNAILITKQASGVAKIDALMALLDAFWCMLKNPESRTGRSVYEEIAARAQAAKAATPDKPRERAIATPLASKADPDDERFWNGAA
jgi:phage terminase large subunit-like protein